MKKKRLIADTERAKKLKAAVVAENKDDVDLRRELICDRPIYSD